MHTGFGTCCAECAQKQQTLGMLGWLPSGFGGLGNTCTPEGDCGTPYGPLPTKGARPPEAHGVLVDEGPSAGAYRVGALIGLGIGSLLSYGGYRLWKGNHQVWGTLVLLLGFPGVVSGSYQLVTGSPLLGRR